MNSNFFALVAAVNSGRMWMRPSSLPCTGYLDIDVDVHVRSLALEPAASYTVCVQPPTFCKQI